LLSFCLEYARMEPPMRVDGVFESIQTRFGRFNKSQLFERVEHIRNFRNKYVAHSTDEVELTDLELAKVELKNWATGLVAIYKAAQVVE